MFVEKSKYRSPLDANGVPGGTHIKANRVTLSDLSYITVLQEVTDERTNQLKKYLKDAMIFE